MLPRYDLYEVSAFCKKGYLILRKIIPFRQASNACPLNCTLTRKMLYIAVYLLLTFQLANCNPSPFSAIDAAFRNSALPLARQALHLRQLAVRLFEQDASRFRFRLSLLTTFATQVYSDGSEVTIAARGASEATAALGSFLSEHVGRSIDALVDGGTSKVLPFPLANYTHRRLDRLVSWRSNKSRCCLH